MSYRTKYPRTPHLPWSPGVSDDDVRVVDLGHFEGREVVVTEKLDGENTTLYRDHLHARSLDSAHHPSRTQVKRIHGRIAGEIPEGWRICGENMQARHSIQYLELLDYFYVFSIWTADNVALSWPETVAWCELLELPTVPVLKAPGLWNADEVQALELDTERQEGYVVRVTDGFAYDQFATHLAKWVRRAHVQSDQHWMHQEMVPNQLKGDRNEREH